MTSNNETVSHYFDLRAGNIAKSMTSECNSVLLPANVDRRPPLQRGFIMNFQLQISFGKQLILFPSIPPIKCLLLNWEFASQNLLVSPLYGDTTFNIKLNLVPVFRKADILNQSLISTRRFHC